MLEGGWVTNWKQVIFDFVNYSNHLKPLVKAHFSVQVDCNSEGNNYSVICLIIAVHCVRLTTQVPENQGLAVKQSLSELWKKVFNVTDKRKLTLPIFKWNSVATKVCGIWSKWVVVISVEVSVRCILRSWYQLPNMIHFFLDVSLDLPRKKMSIKSACWCVSCDCFGEVVKIVVWCTVNGFEVVCILCKSL